jgi:hypothetical protein
MKTDVVLTMDEYLDQCRAFRKPVSPPASDARHVSITAENEPASGREAYGRRCDLWGHPCSECVKPPHGAEQHPAVFREVTIKS